MIQEVFTLKVQIEFNMTRTNPSTKRFILADIFISSSERRLRAGWRLSLQVLLQIFLTLLIGLAIFIPYIIHSGLIDQNSESFLVFGEIVEFVSISVSVFLARRFLDKRSFKSLGFKLDRQALADLLTGITITFVVMGMIFLAEQVLGWLTWQSFAWTVQPLYVVAWNLIIYFGIFLLVGWNEELMSRGYHLQTIGSGLNLRWGLIISSAVFGVLHLGNPHATWLSAGGIFLAGLFLGYAYIRTKQLWLSIGIHIGWNFFEGVVFGFPVSGLNVYHLARITVSGPVWWTGGEFGPEAGLIVIPAIIIGIGLIHLYTRSRTSL